uniref:Eukaryotic elongation factor 2 lysine methyltransferase n=1 Tax=Canis lupus familiaris TaxID=9615 RepID=A0A8C0MLM8_CANLF
MAPEESAEAAGLLQSFESRYLAARTLRSFPWQSLEEKLRDSSGPELLLIILQKHEAVHTEPLDELYEALAEVLMPKEPTQCHRSYLLMCCIAQKPSSPWSESCRGSLLARASRLRMPTLPSLSATRRPTSCSLASWARLGSPGKQCLITTRSCFPMKNTQTWQF